LPHNGRDPDGSVRFTFALPQEGAGTGRADVTYAVEVTTNAAAGPWSSAATKPGHGAWTGAATVTSGPAEGGFVPVSVRLVPPAGAESFLARLRFQSP
jgi:hypothetical protein